MFLGAIDDGFVSIEYLGLTLPSLNGCDLDQAFLNTYSARTLWHLLSHLDPIRQFLVWLTTLKVYLHQTHTNKAFIEGSAHTNSIGIASSRLSLP